MYLHSLATAVPPHRFTQQECWEIAERSKVRETLARRSQLVLRAILMGDSGVATRHFATENVERLLDLESDELNQAFRREAPRLASLALEKSLRAAGLKASDVDMLLICTCTGYLCPGVTSYVAEQMGLRSDAFLQDLVGLGCGAAIPMLRSARALLVENPHALVATVAVEVCSAAFYLDDDLGVLVSACLFGDGAAAAIWRAQPGPTGLRCSGFRTLHQPENRDRIRFDHRNGKLRNLLHPTVPDLAAQAVAELFEQSKSDENGRRLSRILSHTGGRDVIDRLQERFAGHDFSPSRAILRDYGNMSSPSVLFALDYLLGRERPSRDEDWWLVSFGAGFSAHSCRIGH